MPFRKGKSGNAATMFQPGKSGNPSGPGKGFKHLSTVLRDMLSEDLPVIEDGKKVKKKLSDIIIRKLIIKAMAGDIKAIREILDRTEGKAGQMIEIKTSTDYSRLSVKEREILRQLYQKAEARDE